MLALLGSRAPTLGSGRLLCIDGPAGSGKTTLAAAISAAAPACTVVHVDDLLDGWDGLPTLAARMDPLLGALSHDVPGRYERYDWDAGRFTETVPVDPAPLLVLEGVGSGSRRHAHLTTALVWVEVDDDLRLSRGMERDGEAARPHWERWMLDERRHFVDDGTRARADMVV